MSLGRLDIPTCTFGSIVVVFLMFVGHGPFSHLFDSHFIPKVNPGTAWKVQ